MSGNEEETYSLMFSSLRHPARRKILRMLSAKAMTFSQMLEELAIPSSHLTYHLENLGELVIKEQDGKYKLSSFGNASVTMMRGAEEVPNAKSIRFTVLPLKWKSFLVAFMIVIVVLASLSAVQYSSFSKLSNDFGLLKIDNEKLHAENQQLLSMKNSAEKASVIISNVLQIDVSKYQATMLSYDAQARPELGGIVEEVMRYSLVNSESSIDLTLKFRNSHFALVQINQIEGLPNFPVVYTQQQPADALEAARGILQRYTLVANDSYVEEVNRLLAGATNSNVSQTLGNSKLTISSYGDTSEVLIEYTNNGTDFVAKSLDLKFQSNLLSEFSDDWFLYGVGNTQVNVSREQAILIARNAARSFSWNASGVQVSNFEILDNPVSAEFYPHPRSDYLTLIPYWYVILYLDKTYPGNVSEIAVGVWADTGVVANIRAFGSA